MSVDAFVDTNVLVYAASGDAADGLKRDRAFALLQAELLGLSAQVLQEFYVTVTRRIVRPLARVEALMWLEQFEAFPCVPVDAGLVHQAAWLSERYQISYWDGAIVAAAQALEAPVLYSEDLNSGQRYEGIEVRNPFLEHQP